jgi:hypothetical protein
MEERVYTYQLQYDSIWSTVDLKKGKDYYSLKQALYALKRIIIMDSRIRERYQAHDIILYVVHFEDGERIGRQRVDIKL